MSKKGEAKAKLFLEGKSEGYCPKCGTHCACNDADEGSTTDHWFSRGYWCEKCDLPFYEEYRMVPRAIYQDDEDGPGFYAG